MKKTFLLLVAILALAALGWPIHAQVIDDFSTSDSGNYHAFNAFQSGASATATFAVNGSSQLQPTGGSGNTTIYLRNTGQFLSDTTFGESVSLDLVAIADPSTDDGSQLGADSIGFATTLSPTPGTSSSYSPNAFELGILRDAGAYAIASSNTSIPQAAIPVDADFTLGAITETITRLSDTGFHYSFSGPGLIGPALTGNFTVSLAAGQNIYFGPDIFGGNTAGDQIEDNLSFAVPEPSTYALMLAGVAFLGFLARRTRINS